MPYSYYELVAIASSTPFPSSAELMAEFRRVKPLEFRRVPAASSCGEVDPRRRRRPTDERGVNGLLGRRLLEDLEGS